MKKLLIILLILLSEISFGQDDSIRILPLRDDFYPIASDSMSFRGAYFIQRQQTKKDTVAAIMLVCDTSHSVYGVRFVADSVPKNSMYLVGHYKNLYGSPNYNAYWVNGFEERERIYTCCDPADYGLASYYWLTKSVRYLDADKKELPKNIIVWMSKGINQ